MYKVNIHFMYNGFCIIKKHRYQNEGCSISAEELISENGKCKVGHVF